MTVKLIYENGVFTPVHPVNLPEKFEVEIPLPEDSADSIRREAARKDIMEILSHRYSSGQTDTAERHNEHQP
jgi:predicted DNA-binding antitoxin AbrB/MazE fold protein